jgi:hypothetical protein
MPPLIAAMLVGAGAYAGLRAFQRILSGLSEIGTSASHQAGDPSAASIVVKDLGPLELDPATGVYRPVKPLR